MKKTLYKIALLTGLFILSSFILKDDSDKVIGTWLTSDKDAKIEIFEGKDSKYYGKIVWLKEPNNEDGSPKLDKENPDKSKRDQPILELLLLKGFEYNGDLTWEDGEIYDPQSGSTYSCYLELVEENKLKVRGYLGLSLLGRTEYWTRTK